MNWRKAKDHELEIVIACDEMARFEDILDAKAELERRRRKPPKVRVQYKIRQQSR